MMLKQKKMKQSKQKKQKKQKRNLRKLASVLVASAYLMCIVVSLFGLFYTTTMHEGYLHNIDLIYNVLQVSNSMNNFYHNNSQEHWMFDYKQIGDRYNINEFDTLENLYIMSMKEIRKIFLLSTALTFSISIMITYFYFKSAGLLRI